MSDVFYQSPAGAAAFTQTDNNRTRTEACKELLEFTGGVDRPEAQARAGKAWDGAVREFNTVAWRFNRRTQNITLVGDPVTKTYTLSATFRSPYRAVLLDASGNEKWLLDWLPYEDWLELYTGITIGGGRPDYWTAFNSHNQGLVRFEPYPSGTLSYPTCQIQYFCRIDLAINPNSVLNVPDSVDEAIFQLAAANLKERTTGDARDMFGRAKALRLECEREWQDWPALGGWGANG